MTNFQPATLLLLATLTPDLGVNTFIAIHHMGWFAIRDCLAVSQRKNPNTLRYK
jgi:hypothetical protein